MKISVIIEHDKNSYILSNCVIECIPNLNVHEKKYSFTMVKEKLGIRFGTCLRKNLIPSWDPCLKLGFMLPNLARIPM